jgi:hypothetical protein
MNLLLGFAPFLAFALLSHTVGSLPGLLAAALVSAMLVLREVARGREPKLLELGTLLLFGGLSIYTLVAAPAWSIMGVRLVVDTGLLLIVLGSLLIDKPFTIQYAKEDVPQELWNTPAFLATDRTITGVWAVVFVLLIVADILLLDAPQVPHRVGILLTIAALVGGVKFTQRIADSAGRAE